MSEYDELLRISGLLTGGKKKPRKKSAQKSVAKSKSDRPIQQRDFKLEILVPCKYLTHKEELILPERQIKRGVKVQVHEYNPTKPPSGYGEDVSVVLHGHEWGSHCGWANYCHEYPYRATGSVEKLFNERWQHIYPNTPTLNLTF